MKKTSTLSALARMMAGENISISHSATATTAMFDLRNRKLTLPMWKDMSDDLYDLFLSHEIGHARWTPMEGWHGSLHRNGRSFKGYLNVIEDARIERKVKEQFPALNRVYARAYQELMNRDFFGLKKYNVRLDDLPLIDRININTKCGSIMPCRYTAEEQVFLDRALKTETWEDVEKLALDIFEFEKKQKPKVTKAHNALKELEDLLEGMRSRGSEGADGIEERKKKADVTPQGNTVDGQRQLPEAPDFDWVTQDDKDAMAEDAKQKIEDLTEEIRNRDDKKQPQEVVEGEKEAQEALIEEQLKHTVSNDDLNDYSELEAKIKEAREELEKAIAEDQRNTVSEPPVSMTDEEFRAAEEELTEVSDRHDYGNDNQLMVFDDGFRLSDFVVPNHRVERTLSSYRNQLRYGAKADQEALKKYLRDEAQVINQLAAEFEMRKNAAQYARAGSSKTGEINLKNIHKARFSEDIFKRLTKMPDGKSHGMIMYLDQSGSMEGLYARTIEQIITLVEFCRRMSIPYAVYGFNDSTRARSEWFANKPAVTYPQKPTPGQVQISSDACHLKEYFVSTNSPAEHSRNLANFWMLRSSGNRPDCESLHGTPMNTAIMLSGKMTKEFQRATKVDIVNVLFLTDGEAGDGVDMNASRFTNASGTARVLYGDKLSPMFKRDGYNRKTVTAAMARLMSDVTGANYIGVYIPTQEAAAMQAARSFGRTLYDGTKKTSARPYTMAREGFVSTGGYGFDEFFIIKPIRRNTDAEIKDFSSGASANQIAKAFSEYAKSKTSRAFLSVFATAISGRIMD